MKQKFKQLIPWQLWLTLAVAAVNMTLILVIDGWTESGDTWSYERCIDTILQQGFDTHRTIGYPLLIALCHKLFGVGIYYQCVIAVQVGLFFISTFVLWHLLKSLTLSSVTATVFSVFYAVVPCISVYATVLNNESLTITFVIFLTASAFYIIRGKANLPVIFAFFISLTVILVLRPSSMSFMGAVAVLLVAVFVLRRRYRYALVGLVILALVLPAFQYVKTSEALGVRTPTIVSMINRYMLIYRCGKKVNPDNTPDPELRRAIIHYDDSIPDMPYNQAYDFIVFLHKQKALDSLLIKEGTPWVGLGSRIETAFTEYPLFSPYYYFFFSTPYVDTMSHKTAFSLLRYWLYPVVLVLGMVVGLLQWRRDRRFPWFTLFLLASLSAAMATALLYGPDSFDRLTIPGAPAFILLAAIPFGKRYLIPPYNNQQPSEI